MENLFNEITKVLCVSVRKYFMVLRLAIYHTDGEYLETSAEIAQYDKSDDVYKCAIRILQALQRKEFFI